MEDKNINKNKNYPNLKKIALDYITNNFDKIPTSFLKGYNKDLGRTEVYTKESLIKYIKSRKYGKDFIEWVIVEFIINKFFIKDFEVHNDEYWVAKVEDVYIYYNYTTNEFKEVKPKYKMIKTLVYE